MRAQYDEHCCDYWEHIISWREGPHGDPATQFYPFPSFSEWIGRAHGIPGGETLRDAFEHAFYTVGSAGPSSSRHTYRTRQIQSVAVIGSDTHASVDHTFHTAANFAKQPTMPKAKAVWNGMTGWLRVFILVLVRTTGIREVNYVVGCTGLADRHLLQYSSCAASASVVHLTNFTARALHPTDLTACALHPTAHRIDLTPPAIHPTDLTPRALHPLTSQLVPTPH